MTCATPVQCNAKGALSSHFTVHVSHPAHRTSHLHFTFDTSSHLKSCELFSPHLSSSHLIPSLLTFHLSKFFSTVCISPEHWSTFLISSKFVSTHLSCSARQKALTVRGKSLAQKTIERRKFLHTDAWDTDAFTQKSLSKILCHKALPSTSLHYKTCTKYIPVLLCTTKLAQSTPQYYFVLQSLHKVHSSTTLYYKACTKHSPVLLCTTKLAESTSQYYFVLQSLHEAIQYYFVLQSLHKALPSITLYYKARTKHVPVLLCITRLAQSTSQDYFVLQSLHKVPPSLTLYYKTCTKHPVLLCTTKLAQSAPQYYFVLQSLHKVRPSTNLWYKACTKHFPVLLCTTELAQSTSQYYFVLQSLHKLLPSTTLYYKACTQYFPVLLCTTKLAGSTSQYYFALQSLHKVLPSTTLYYRARPLLLFHIEAWHTANFYTKNCLHREAFLFIMTAESSGPKPDISTPAPKKTRFWSTLKRIFFKRKNASGKIAKNRWQITVATLMQPLQYNLQCPAAKDNNITRAASAASNLDAVITLRSATTDATSA